MINISQRFNLKSVNMTKRKQRKKERHIIETFLVPDSNKSDESDESYDDSTE